MTPSTLPPGLKHSLPFYALKPWVKLGNPILLFEYLHKTFGPIAHYRFMGTPIVFLNDPDYIRELLINQAPSFVKERTLRRMKILLGEGLITSDDPIHLRQRRIAAPAFHRARIAAYADQIVASAAAHAGRIIPGQTVDIGAAMMDLSLEIVARTLFDTEVTPDILRINDEVNTIMGIYNFLIAFPKLERFLHLPIPGVMKFRRSRARLNAVVDRMIAEHRAAALRGDPDKGDLLAMLLASTYEPEAEDSSAPGRSPAPGGALPSSAQPAPEGMSNQQVRDEVLTIFLAGYETVANALTWTWYLLAQNPVAEARLHAELDTVLGPSPLPAGNEESSSVAEPFASASLGKESSSRPERSEVERRPHFVSPPQLRLPTLADYPNLPYTERVFAESMRLYPPAWAMGRMSTRPVTFGPYTLPAGSHVFCSQYIMHRDPAYFPDPLRFDPDRHTPEARAARPKFAYFPFGGGSRQCIGESFAWMEGVLALATIAQRWRFTCASALPPEVQPKITLRPRHPILMQAHPR